MTGPDNSRDKSAVPRPEEPAPVRIFRSPVYDVVFRYMETCCDNPRMLDFLEQFLPEPFRKPLRKKVEAYVHPELRETGESDGVTSSQPSIQVPVHDKYTWTQMQEAMTAEDRIIEEMKRAMAEEERVRTEQGKALGGGNRLPDCWKPLGRS